jgi:hypothetical protein
MNLTLSYATISLICVLPILLIGMYVRNLIEVSPQALTPGQQSIDVSNLNVYDIELLNKELKHCLYNNVSIMDSSNEVMSKHSKCLTNIYGFLMPHLTTKIVSNSFKRFSTSSDKGKSLDEHNFKTLSKMQEDSTFWDVKKKRVRDDRVTLSFLYSFPDIVQYELELIDFRFYCLSKFKNEHPDSVVDSFDKLNQLVNIHKKTLDWFRKTKEEFNTITTAPNWMKGDSQDLELWKSEYIDLSIQYKHSMRKFEDRKNMIYSETKEKLSSVDKDKLEYINNNFNRMYVIMINKITQASLPFNRIEKHMGLSKEKLDITLSKELDSYKLELLNGVKKGDISMEELRDILKEALTSN